MPQFARHFTLIEANALIPWVRAMFARIHELVRRAGAGPLAPPSATSAAGGNGHGAPPPLPEDAIPAGLDAGQMLHLAQGLLEAIAARGIVIRDVERGLIDFPSWRDGEEILLCYELRDGGAIGFWHDLESGYAGRRPIDARTGLAPPEHEP